MAIGLALLVSADPVTIQQFSHALQELSISGAGPQILRTANTEVAPSLRFLQG